MIVVGATIQNDYKDNNGRIRSSSYSEEACSGLKQSSGIEKVLCPLDCLIKDDVHQQELLVQP